MWQVVRTEDGSPTLAHPSHGETCHSRAGAWQEARERYASACRIGERARDRSDLGAGGVLRLLDVGTGLGFNLASALEALDGTGVRLDAVTLELDPEVLARTIEVARAWSEDELPSGLARWHAPVRAALETVLATRAAAVPIGADRGRLALVLGDGRTTLFELAPELRFDAVFLDPFSPAVDASLWEPRFLGEIARRMAPASWLSTYSASLEVRARLARAGLRVGPGGRVGTKREGTVASPDRELAPFDPRTARRLARRAAAEPS